MYVKIKASGIKAFVNHVSDEFGFKVYTLSEPEIGKPIWNGNHRTFDEAQVIEIQES